MSLKRVLIGISGLTGLGAVGAVMRFEEVRHYSSEIMMLFDGCSRWSGCIQRAFELNTINILGITAVGAIVLLPIASAVFKRLAPRVELNPQSPDDEPFHGSLGALVSERQSITVTVVASGSEDVTTHVLIGRRRLSNEPLKIPARVLPLHLRSLPDNPSPPQDNDMAGVPINRSCAIKMDRCKKMWSGKLYSLSELGCSADIGSRKFNPGEKGTVYLEVGVKFPWKAPRALSCRFVISNVEPHGRLNLTFDPAAMNIGFHRLVTQIIGKEVFRKASNEG